MCVLVAAAVLLPRAWLISRAHSETHDADPHLRRGLATLLGTRRDLGLSLGDCVCLTVAAASGAVAVTADRRWKELDGVTIGGERIRVELIR